MIDFTTVSREFRSLVSRREELSTFLGSVFAALGLVLQNVLQGGLPRSLEGLQRHGFAFCATVLMVMSLVLALRMARLHGGMVYNGILFARLMVDQSFTKKGNPQRAARHNLLGVSFLQFVLVNLVAGFSGAILFLTVGIPLVLAMALAAVLVAAWFLLYFRFHDQSAQAALKRAAADTCTPFTRNEWEDHMGASVQQANQGMIAEIAFAGLMVFSVIESLSGLGKMDQKVKADLRAEDIIIYGPLVYATLMTVTCFLEMLIYLRVRVAAGSLWLQIDPTDQPFRPLMLTDSLLGYLLIVFLFAISVHILLFIVAPGFQEHQGWLLAIDGVLIVLGIAAEQLMLVVMGRQAKR